MGAFIISLIILIPVSAMGQGTTGTIRGRIVDRSTGLPLFESEPLNAQSSSNDLSDKWLFGISTGVLTASAPQLVRHYLPPLIGITARKRLSSGSFFIADAYYSRWRETLSFSDRYPQISFVWADDSTLEEYPQFPEAIRMDSVQLSVGYETSIGLISGLPIQIGGKLGLRFFKEKWEYEEPRWLSMGSLIEIGGYVPLPPPAERRETQLTASLRIGLPLGEPNEGRGIYADYTLPHSIFQWTGGNAPSRSSDSGLRVVIVHSFNSVPRINEKNSDESGDTDTRRVYFMVGSAGLGSSPSRWHGESLFGLQMSWKLVTGLGLDAEVVTVDWKDGKFRSRDISPNLLYAYWGWWFTGRMLVDGRIWEANIGPTYSPTRGLGPQVAIGVFAGIRRQEERWTFNIEDWSYFSPEALPDSPGIQVEGLLGLKLLAALSSRSNAVRAQISLTRKRWQISPDEPNNAVETDGYRIVFLIPIDTF